MESKRLSRGEASKGRRKKQGKNLEGMLCKVWLNFLLGVDRNFAALALNVNLKGNE